MWTKQKRQKNKNKNKGRKEERERESEKEEEEKKERACKWVCAGARVNLVGAGNFSGNQRRN